MNSDFQEAFEERCEWIQPVFDHFHIIRNFNDKVVGSIRKDEQLRLREEGRIKEADALKRTKYILTSSRETLKRKDQEARDGKVISKAMSSSARRRSPAERGMRPNMMSCWSRTGCCSLWTLLRRSWMKPTSHSASPGWPGR